MSDLNQLCLRLHAALRSGESWLESLKSAVFTDPALLAEAERKAQYYRNIDSSLDKEVFAKAILAVGWLRLRRPPSEEFCVGEIKTMLSRWALRVTEDRKRNKAEVKATDVVIDEIPDSTCETIQRFDEELFRLALLEWINKYKEPKRAIAMLRIEQGRTNKEVADLLQLRESTTSEHWSKIRRDLSEKIHAWREG